MCTSRRAQPTTACKQKEPLAAEEALRRACAAAEMAQMSLSHTQPAVSPARLSARTHVAQRVMPRAIGSRASRTARQQASSITASADKQEVICVTGATGFVGKALVKKLLAEGAKVRVLTR